MICWRTSLSGHSLDTQVELLGAQLARCFERDGAENEWALCPTDPQAAVNRDMMQARLLLSNPRLGPRMRVWRNCRALVVPRSFRNRDGFEAAVAASPVPVVLRDSGGSAVMHGPHVLNLSLALPMPRAHPLRIEDAFGAFARAVRGPLGKLGVDVQMADVARAHCPGRFTLAAKGRKIAGTAAFVREQGEWRVALIHCNLVIAQHRDDLETIIGFETVMGLSADYLPDAHTSIAETNSRLRSSKWPC